MSRIAVSTLIVLLAFALAGTNTAGQVEGRTWLSEILSQSTPASDVPIWDYEVVNTYPHDPTAFTQGLVYIDGELFEGTGQNGESNIRRVDLESGDVLQRRDLDDDYFGEGIAVVDDRIFQITWTTREGFIYDRESFELLDSFSYSGEGWGLTWNGSHLVMSNGTNIVVFRDPETFLPVRQVEVRDKDGPVSLLNELEWFDGEIWANVYRTDWIVRIDPETGDVNGWIDLTGILPLDSGEDPPGPLNGIAMDEETGRIFVTGKYWPELYEIELVERT